MRQVRLIRHGESAAGEASLDHATIPLTPKGVGQAYLVACSFRSAPDLIVASPFSRAASPAMATAAKFMAVPLETWPTQEFTYLEPGRCANTTVTQRREWVDAHWSRSDPAFRDGPGPNRFWTSYSGLSFCWIALQIILLDTSWYFRTSNLSMQWLG